MYNSLRYIIVLVIALSIVSDLYANLFGCSLSYPVLVTYYMHNVILLFSWIFEGGS